MQTYMFWMATKDRHRYEVDLEFNHDVKYSTLKETELSLIQQKEFNDNVEVTGSGFRAVVR
jgi:hypothetical protein